MAASLAPPCSGPLRAPIAPETAACMSDNGDAIVRPTKVVAFNTDAAHLGKTAGLALVGPGDIQVAHSDTEHIGVTDLAAGAALYARLAREWLLA